eukprot:7462916-Karenia_brevis.AAC.1
MLRPEGVTATDTMELPTPLRHFHQCACVRLVTPTRCALSAASDACRHTPMDPAEARGCVVAYWHHTLCFPTFQ